MSLATVITLIVASTLFFVAGPLAVGATGKNLASLFTEVAFLIFVAITVAVGASQAVGTQFLEVFITFSLFLGWVPIILCYLLGKEVGGGLARLELSSFVGSRDNT